MRAVETCGDCGRLASFLPRARCADCQDLREERFRLVKAHLDQDGGASIASTASATGVDEGLIAAFIREGRITYGGADAARFAGADEEDLKARLRAQLAAKAGPSGTDPRGTDPQGPAAASLRDRFGMRTRAR